MATLSSGCGRYEQALSYLDAATRHDPTFPGISYERANVLAEMGRGDQALQLLQEVTSRNPDGRSLTLLAQVAESQGKLELAIQALRKAIEIEPMVEDHYLDLSLLCAKYKNDHLAGEIIDLGLKKIPQSYRLLVQKGITLEKLGKRDESERVFSLAMGLQKDHSVALAGLAILQLIRNEFGDALKTLSAGSRDFPEDFYIHYLYAYALERSVAIEGNNPKITEEARQNLEKAISLRPSFAESYYLLGKVYAHTDIILSIANFETALQLDPTDVAAKYQLARLYLKVGNQKDGERLMAEVEKEKADKLVEERKPQIMVVEK